MTVSHAHARNACAHEQSTNIESGAVQWHKQLAERANTKQTICGIVA